MTWALVLGALGAVALAVRAWLRRRTVEHVARQVDRVWAEAQKRIDKLPDPDRPVSKTEVGDALRDYAARGRDPE